MQLELDFPKPLPRIIGITGKAGVGKDTLAAYLELGEGYYCYSLAQPLKRGIEEMFNLSPSIWKRENKEEVISWIGKSPRQLAQTLGTEWGRNCVAPDIWLRCLQQVIDNLPSDAEGLVIPDVRFENEARFIRDQGGVIVRVLRDTEEVNPHVSEQGLADELVNAEIENGSTYTQFYSDAIEILSNIPQRGHKQ